MWIRGQDKTVLVDATCFEVDEYGKYEEDSATPKTVYRLLGGFNINNHCWDLGEFSTKEKALKVLDRIQEVVQGIKKTEYDYKDEKKIITHYYFENKRQIVFQMPQDSEVE